VERAYASTLPFAAVVRAKIVLLAPDRSSAPRWPSGLTSASP